MSYKDCYGSTIDIFFGDFEPDATMHVTDDKLFIINNDTEEIYENFTSKVLIDILDDWNKFKTDYYYSITLDKWMIK